MHQAAPTWEVAGLEDMVDKRAKIILQAPPLYRQKSQVESFKATEA